MSTAVEHVRDVILRDGSHAAAAPPVPPTRRVCWRSSASLRREHVQPVPRLSVAHEPSSVAPVLDPDWQERGALIGTLGEGGDARRRRELRPAARPVGRRGCVHGRGRAPGAGGRYAPARAARGSGGGGRHRVIRRRRHELEPAHAAGLRGRRLLHLARVRAGRRRGRLSIVPTGEYRDRVDERDHVAVAASLAAVLLAARRSPSWAHRQDAARSAASSTATSSRPTSTASPTRQSQGRARRRRACVHDASRRFPTPSTSRSSASPGEHVLAAAEDALGAGTKGLCVISAGFAEIGPKGRLGRSSSWRRRAHTACASSARTASGIAVTRPRLNATFAPRAFPPGNVALSSQSGALGLGAAGGRGRSGSRRLRVRLHRQQGGRVVERPARVLGGRSGHGGRALYLESFGNPGSSVASPGASRAEKADPRPQGRPHRRGCPRNAVAHGCARGLGGAVDALFHQAGVIRADTLEELVDVSALLSTQPLPRGRRVALITNAGGLGILAADACEAAGLELPELSEETRACWPSSCPAKQASPIPSTCLARPRRRRSRRYCRTSCAIAASTR